VPSKYCFFFGCVIAKENKGLQKKKKVLNGLNAYLEGKGVIVNCCACFQAWSRQSEEKEFPRFWILYVITRCLIKLLFASWRF